MSKQRSATVDQLEALYRGRYEHFARVASAITGDGEAGRDAVQRAFAAAIESRGAFRGEGPLEAWLWRIVVNEARRQARERPVVELVGEHEPAANGHGTDELGLRSWIGALPDRQREVLFLRYYADLDYRTIAAALGIEVGTVSATLSAAQTKLRKLLTEVER